MIEAGELGDIRGVQVEYPQDWLTEPMENEGLKQAEWRTDPSRSGAGGSVGDIGTHAHNLACFVSGLSVQSLAADLQAFGAGRQLDDNAHVLLRFGGGARGMLWSSQVAPGNENALKPAHLWPQGRVGMVAGGSKLSVVYPIRGLQTSDHARRIWRQCRRRRGQSHPGRPPRRVS